jgi:hypothetical protein
MNGLNLLSVPLFELALGFEGLEQRGKGVCIHPVLAWHVECSITMQREVQRGQLKTHKINCVALGQKRTCKYPYMIWCMCCRMMRAHHWCVSVRAVYGSCRESSVTIATVDKGTIHPFLAPSLPWGAGLRRLSALTLSANQRLTYGDGEHWWQF